MGTVLLLYLLKLHYFLHPHMGLFQPGLIFFYCFKECHIWEGEIVDIYILVSKDGEEENVEVQ